MATLQVNPEFGAREVYDSEKLADERLADRLTRTGRFVDFIKKRRPNDGRDRAMINEAILGYTGDQTKEPIDLDELEKRGDLFTMDEGFTFYPRPEYPAGQEPATAPLTREQMRLLLVSTLPPELVPFVQEHFVFHYDGDADKADQGPSVAKDPATNKLHLTFYRDNFLNEVIPAAYLDSLDNQKRSKYLRGLIDPSKVVMVIGKVVAQLIPAPDNWAELIDPNFAVTAEKERPKKGKKGAKPSPSMDKDRLAKQWEDFVGLAMTAPDVAAKRLPQAFDHYKQQLKDFEYIENDSEKLSKLDAMNWADFNIVIDLRTQAEREAAQPAEPQLAWYDHFITYLNRHLVKFGKKIVYQKPNDPIRDTYLAESDKQVQELLLTTDETTRDVAYGQRLQESSDYHTRDRYESFAYLMAFSRAGEFAEWRIYAWLYKFSKVFRQTNGKQISDQDFRDLQTVYRQSEDQGHRFGTSTMPFEAMPVPSPYHGRPIFIYHAINREKYRKLVEKKVQAKNDRTVQDVNEEVFNRFYIQLPDGQKTAIPYDATFDPDLPDGLQTSSGNLKEILGDNLATSIGSIMRDQKVDRISADAKAVARTLHNIYLSQGRKFTDRWNRESRDVVLRYENQLNAPPEEMVKQALTIDTATVMASEDASHIAKAVGEVKQAREVVEQSISVGSKYFNQQPGQAEPQSDIRLTLSAKTREFLNEALKDGLTDPGHIMQRLNPLIEGQIFADKPLLIEQEKQNLRSFLIRMRDNLTELDRLIHKQRELEPRYSQSLREGGDILAKEAKDQTGETVERLFFNGQYLDQAKAKVLEDLKLVRVEELKNIEKDEERKAMAEQAKTTEGTSETKAEPIQAVVDPEVVKGRQLELIRERIGSQVNGERIVGQLLSTVLKELNNSYLYDASKGLTPSDRFNVWLREKGQILALSPLGDLRLRLQSAIGLIGSGNESIAREGGAKLESVMMLAERAIKYEEELLREKSKEKGKKEPGATEE